MRNQKDPIFANLCDRVGSGTYTKDDVAYLTQCVRKTESENDNNNFKNGKISIIVITNKVRQEINEDKLKTLLKGGIMYTSVAVDRCTNLENPPEVSSKLSLTQTGGLESTIFLKNDAPVVITSNHPQSKFKEDGIVNGARGYVDSVQVSKTEPEKIDVIWVTFKDKNIGKLLRYEYRNLKKMHKPNDENAVPILRQKKGFTTHNGEIKFQRHQFPLTLSYAITSYKCQGDTLEEVIIDFDSEPGNMRNIPYGSFYVALTRVKEGKNVYLRSFSENFITNNKRVEEKIQAMRMFKSYEFKKVYVIDSIYEDDSDQLKIGYFNISGFMQSNHAAYLDKDINLLNLDYLVVSETWLSLKESNITVINKLKNWRIIKRLDATDNIKHMGLLLLSPYSSNKDEETLYALDYVEGYKSNSKTLLYQGLVMDIKNYYKRIVFLYIRETPNSDEILKISNRFRNFDCIIGDLNLNPAIFEQKKKLLEICGKSKQMLLEEITTRNETQLDHVIVETKMKENSFTTSYHNFASYHKSIVLRITSITNKFASYFKQKVSFDSDNHLKRSSRHQNQEETRETNQSHKSDKVFKILAFSNPPRSNLCFSNAVASLLLNIPILQDIITSDDRIRKVKEKDSEIINELIRLCQSPQFSNQSTNKFRTLVKAKCFKAGQVTRNFNNKLQHDAGEFMTSTFEHMFKEPVLPIDIDERIFGGILQEKLTCACGKSKLLPIQKLPDIWTVQVEGESIQSCIDNFLSIENVELNCEGCVYAKVNKQIQILLDPNTLIVQLKRYEFDHIQQKILKKHAKVFCPAEITLPGGSKYSLSSILNHTGSSPEKGHYTLTLFDKETKSFTLLDDSFIDEDMNVSEELWMLSYIVCYAKC